MNDICGSIQIQKPIDTDHTASTDCNNNYRVILLMMLFITSLITAFKTDLSREI